MSTIVFRPVRRGRIFLPTAFQSAVQSVTLQPARSTAAAGVTVPAAAGHVSRPTLRQVRRYGGGTQIAFSVTPAVPQLAVSRSASTATAKAIGVTKVYTAVLTAAGSTATAKASADVSDRTVVISAAHSAAAGRTVGGAFLATPGGFMRGYVRPIARYVIPPLLVVREQGITLRILSLAQSTATAKAVTFTPPTPAARTFVMGKASSDAKVRGVKSPVFSTWSPLYQPAGPRDVYSPRFIRVFSNPGEQTIVVTQAHSAAQGKIIALNNTAPNRAVSNAVARPVKVILTRVMAAAASTATAKAATNYEFLRVLSRAVGTGRARSIASTGNRIFQVPAATGTASAVTALAGDLLQLEQIQTARSTALVLTVAAAQGNMVVSEVEFDTFVVMELERDTFVNQTVESTEFIGV